LLALLALAVISGGSLAAGDLFDDGYKDCPHKTRLRDGQIDDLSVNRDSDDEDHVNVSWSATDPATWGLGPNAYSTSLVVILDDGDSNTKTLSLGSRKATFEDVETGVEVTVQMAIVVDTADGKYLISDIIEKSINQSLTEPSFSGSWHRIRATTDVRLKGLTADTTPTLEARTAEVLLQRDFQYDSEMIANGAMYYIGYNENFANYRAGTASYSHSPTTQRLRIGLAHSTNETGGERDDVDFEAYIIRIVDSDGDVVDEGDDVATFKTNYGTAPTAVQYDTDGPDATGAGTTGFKTVGRKLFIADLTAGNSAADPATFPGGLTFADQRTSLALQNVRISEGSDDFTVGMHLDSSLARTNTDVTPTSLSIVKVGVSEAPTQAATETAQAAPGEPTVIGGALAAGDVYANPPDEHRDFPIDTLSSDVTYKITAWAINEDDEVISPVATLTLRPINERVTLAGTPATSGLRDYLNTTEVTDAAGVNSGTLIVTEFTVIK